MAIVLDGTANTVTPLNGALGGTTPSTVAATTGTFSGNVTAPNLQGPTFSAYRSSSDGSQSITSGTITKILFPTERWDTNSNFSSSRFTPTVAGYYSIHASVDLVASASITALSLWINKNGTNFVPYYSNITATSEYTASASGLIYMNGSSDYLEINLRATGTSLVAAGQDADATSFNGFLVRSA